MNELIKCKNTYYNIRTPLLFKRIL